MHRAGQVPEFSDNIGQTESVVMAALLELRELAFE